MAERRLFLAVPLTDIAKRTLAEVQAKIIPLFGRRGRTRSESMHLTVKFLGSVPDSHVTRLATVVRESVQCIPPFQLKLDQVTGFGKSDAPRIVAVSLTPVESIRFLAEQVDKACAALGFQRETRSFSPHVTIYRPKNPGKIENQLCPEAEIPVQELILYQSELKPDGAVYHALESFPLSGIDGKGNGNS